MVTEIDPISLSCSLFDRFSDRLRSSYLGRDPFSQIKIDLKGSFTNILISMKKIDLLIVRDAGGSEVREG